MNFGDISGVGGAKAGYITTPEGQNAVRKEPASPESIRLLQKFAGTLEGQKTIVGTQPSSGSCRND